MGDFQIPPHTAQFFGSLKLVFSVVDSHFLRTQATVVPGMLIIRMDASLFFGNINFFKERLFEMRCDDEIRCIVMDWSSVNDIDFTACRVFKMIVEDLQRSDITLLIASVKGMTSSEISQEISQKFKLRRGSERCISEI